MKLNVLEMKNLMDSNYNGNYHAFARATGVNVSLLYRILNGTANAGLKTINQIIHYLKDQDLDIKTYIFLP